MGRKRQKNQMLLAFMAEGRDEFPRAAVEGTELPVAKEDSESPTPRESLMEEVCQRDNLWKALKRVPALRNFVGGEWAKTWRPKPPAAHTGRGASAAARPSRSPCPMPTSTRSASPASAEPDTSNQPNRRGTDPYARWCDRDSPRGPTYVD